MRDSTGKWVSAADLIEMLQLLPPGSRIYSNQVGNLNVTDESGYQWLGIIDFNFGCYESFGEEDADA